MRCAYINAEILTSGQWHTGLAVLVEDGKISDIIPRGDLPLGMIAHDLRGHRLVPGFVDLQVNGGNGILFNEDPSVATLRRIAEAHWQYGTTAFLPTLISDDLAKVRKAISAVTMAIAAGVPGIVGIHIEGPFLNIDRRGIHASEMIRPVDAQGLDTILPVIGGRTLLTLAPECISMNDLRVLLDRGIIVSAGHTSGSYEEIYSAFDAGVVGATHLFNAMPPLANREPGAVGAALNHPDCWCCLIVDGKHVHPATMRIALKAKGGVGRFILVTDAMPTVGQSVKQFKLNGEDISVIDGVCQDEAGTLAGSDLDMAKAVSNAVQMLGVSLAEAVQMAAENPAIYLGMNDRFGTLEVGKAANMVEMDPDGCVVQTWIEGNTVWCKNARRNVA